MIDFNDKINLVIKGKDYEIKFPNVGQFRQIESNKAILSNGMYGQMTSTLLKNSQSALNMIDVESTFRVLAPQLEKDMKCGYKDLSLKDFSELYKVYKDQFLPWYTGILEMVNNPE